MNWSVHTYNEVGSITTKVVAARHFPFTGNDPRKGWRIPLDEIKYNEQRDEEKEMSGGPFASERGEEPRSGMQYCSSLSFTNFGARYMDHELMTMWLSVDPLADKYPSISPYAYCAWNPVKLVDPDGRDVVLSESAQKIHEKYYRKQGYEKYTELYDKLNDDHSIQINVKECNDNAYAKSIGANGVVDYSAIQQDKFSNGCFDIEWGDPNDMHGGTNEHVFLEEFFHAGQMKDANYDLSATYSINKEYDAKLFAVRMSTESYDMTFDDTKNWFFGIPTEMHIINTYEPSTAKDYLQFGINVTVRDRFNGVYNGYKIGGHYNEFPRN